MVRKIGMMPSTIAAAPSASTCVGSHTVGAAELTSGSVGDSGTNGSSKAASASNNFVICADANDCSRTTMMIMMTMIMEPTMMMMLKPTMITLIGRMDHRLHPMADNLAVWKPTHNPPLFHPK